MVKGNKERRQELARRRKEDKATESERRRGGAELATPVEARARLLSDAKALGSEEGLVAWVVQGASEEGVEVKAWCEDYFRTSTCQLRRCRNAHEVTIAHLSHVPQLPGVGAAIPTATRGRSASPAARRAARAASEERSGSDAGSGGGGGGGGGAPAAAAAPAAPASAAPSRSGGSSSGSGGYAAVSRGRGAGTNLSCVPSDAFFPALTRVPLRTVEAGAKLVYSKLLRTTVRTETPLRFVEWQGRLVFDLANPSVFASYCESAIVSGAAAAAAAAVAAAAAAAAGGGAGGAAALSAPVSGVVPSKEGEDEGEEEGEGEDDEEEDEEDEEGGAAAAQEKEARASPVGGSGGVERLRVRFAAVLEAPLGQT